MCSQPNTRSQQQPQQANVHTAAGRRITHVALVSKDVFDKPNAGSQSPGTSLSTASIGPLNPKP